MSQYKTAIRPQPPQEHLSNSKFSAQACQLQEFFPLWKHDDLQSLLVEVGGDVELAAARISDGTVEQWGEVSRKKDKKPPTSTHTLKPSVSPRGDSRVGRGGRGGRGGSGRGGVTTRGRSALPRGSANGAPHTDSTRPSSVAPPNAATPGPTDSSQLSGETSVKPTPSESHDQQNGLTSSISAWTDTSSQPETSTLTTSISANGSTWGATDSFSPEVNATAPVTNIPVSKLPPKTPATSKLSWAQIARPWEKPAIPQTLPPPPLPSVHVSQPVLEPEQQPEVQQHGREEPTTAEAPTWDDEPATSQANGPEAWPLTVESSLEQPKLEPPVASVVEVKSETEDESVPEAELDTESKPEVETRLPVQVTSALPTQVTAAPSPKLATRPAVVSHRTSARYKVTDQPVTMPISFGTGIEKVGMQFGSLSLGGDDTNESTSNEPDASVPASEPASPPTLQAKTVPELAVPPPATAPASSNSLASVFQQQQSAPPQTSTQPPALPQTSISHHSLPTSVSQPIQPTQAPASHTVAATSPLQQFAQQQALVNNNNNNNTHQQHQPQSAQHHQQQSHQQLHQQPPHLQHLPQQVQQSHATHHSYAQLGLPTHIDPSQQTQHPAPQQALQSGPHSNYFRQTETVSNPPYFHTPTPPAAQSQESPYGSFGQLGAQGQHQPSSHHGSFGGADYGYSENQRGFYETYAQQVGFGTRNPTGLDDGKGLPVGQQPTASTLPASNVQGSQQHSSQTGGQPQQSGGQGPQQTYPPPMPYYYPHAYSQNQYYGTPYSSGYVPQPFVKYPAMFQPGPPGPGSANSPAAKQPGGNVGVQPQTNPYNQALYQQGGYDDYQPHPHHSQHQHQHSHSLGLTQGAIGVGSGEYGKQLYGSVAQSGMQGFMGLGGQTGAGGAGPTSNTGPRNTSSPEAAYKPYAAKDVAVSAGRGAPVQQGGQGQGQTQNQGQGQSGQGGPQGQSFYGNRFGNGVGGSGTGGVVGGPQAGGHHQQGGPQGHLGYPQSGSEPNFYGYQPRQQQGYWQ